MKILKIILGVFCFALVINTFRKGAVPGEGFVYYLPIIIVLVIGILLFNSAFKSKTEK